MTPLLEIKEFSIEYILDKNTVRAVDGVSLILEKGELLGLIGESGSGKTTIALSIMGLLPDNSRTSGTIFSMVEMFHLCRNRRRTQ